MIPTPAIVMGAGEIRPGRPGEAAEARWTTPASYGARLPTTDGLIRGRPEWETSSADRATGNHTPQKKAGGEGPA